MKVIKYIILVSSVLLGVSSCVTNRDITYLQNIKAEKYVKSDTADYRIKKRDEISFLLYTVNKEAAETFTSNQTATSETYLVYDDGTIDIPFIHSIKIEGLTVREATSLVERKLKEYIPDAEVKLDLVNKCFYVIGEGNKKGSFPLYKENVNIFEALAMVGDLTLDANRKRITILREENNKQLVLNFDIRAKSIIDSKYYYVQPNDIICVNRSPRGFYKLSSFTSFLAMVSSSLSFVLLVINYSK